MRKQELIKNIEKLRTTVRHHAYLYNTLDAPVISDAAYDSLVKELQKLEIWASEKDQDSNFTVGAEPSTTLLKVAHSLPMLSLTSEQNEKEVVLWYKRLLQKLSPTFSNKVLEWVVEPKVNGLALSLIYEFGNLRYALTRGNGLQGENVTHNAQNVQGIPLTIPHKLPGTDDLVTLLEVRGEIFMSLNHFKELNASKLKAGEKTFSNPRNAAAGSMRLFNAENSKGRPLSFVAYNVANINFPGKSGTGSRSDMSVQVLKTQWEALRVLHSLGFVTNDDNKLLDTFDSALAYARELKDKRHALDYEADGVVLKANDLATQALLGTAGGAPRWAVAWKFEPTEAVTVLEGIDINVGRTGAIIPNARLKPVELGGVIITRASLHSVGHVVDLGLCEGDRIIIQRAGDVIPQVIQVLEELRPSKAKPWPPPKKCPSCESKLTQITASSMIFCQNLSCPSRQSRQIEHFAKTLISGLGSTVLHQLEECGLVVDPADLYLLDAEALSNIKGFGKLSVSKLLKAIEESKQRDVSLFVVALGIPRVGINTAEELAKHFGSLRGLLNASAEDLLSVPGIGEMTAAVIYDWCHSISNTELINKLEAAGCKVNPSIEKHKRYVEPINEQRAQYAPSIVATPVLTGDSIRSESENCKGTNEDLKKSLEVETVAVPKLHGKVVVITGDFGDMLHKDMEKLIKAHGGLFRTSVTSKTNLLVCGNRPGPEKLSQAKEKGVEIVDWVKFHNLIA